MTRPDVLDDWRTRAACRSHDWNWWWEPSHYPDALHQCRVHCPVLAQCREFAAGFHWRECVVAGRVWVAKKDPARGEPSVRNHPSSSRRCATCRGYR